MLLRVVLQSRLGWLFEANQDSDATFKDVLEQFAANTGSHPFAFIVYVGDKVVLPVAKLSQRRALLSCALSTSRPGLVRC